ncbi:MAG: trypsin-like serine protease [Pirellulales bacterium]
MRAVRIFLGLCLGMCFGWVLGSQAATAQAPALKGRRILTAAETQQRPYCYVGRIVNQMRANGIGGVATLVGRRHIVTAAHVIEDADLLSAKLGPILFVLPDGRRSEIAHAELDGGFPKTRYSSYDFGVCTLQDPLGAGGHAAWGVFEDDDFGRTMTLAGYDQDLAGAVRPPPLVVRSGRVQQRRGGGTVAALGAAALLDGARRGRMLGTGLGAGAAVQGLLLQQHLSVGWKGDFYAAEGASGGPIWIDRKGVPTVIGVQSGGFDGDGDRVAEFCLGSRISPGEAEAMVRDHIARNP